MASKTARASMRAGAGAKGAFVRAAGSPRFIPTGKGHFAHVFMADGTSRFVKIGSDDYVAAVNELRESGDSAVDAEIAEFADKYPEAPWQIIETDPADEPQDDA